MKDQIIHELKRLEAEFEIKILYAVESGSRAWGFASTDSDWDVRFIYIHKPEWYLSIDEKKDSLEQILPNDIDLGGWDIRKALKLFNKSNPPLFEWLRSPILYLDMGNFAHLSETYQRIILILRIACTIICIWRKKILKNTFKRI